MKPVIKGTRFRLFGKGRICQVVSIKSGKVRFETMGKVVISGSFPLENLSMHFKGT